MIRDAGSPYIVQPMEKWDNFAESVEVILLIYLLRIIAIRCPCRCLVESARKRTFPLSALSTRISLTQVGLRQVPHLESGLWNIASGLWKLTQVGLFLMI